MTEPTTKAYVLSRDVFNDIQDLIGNAEYNQLSDGVMTALEAATYGQKTATIRLTGREATTLAIYLLHEAMGHPFFFERERYLQRLTDRLRGVATPVRRVSNSLGGWTTADFVRQPRKPHQLLYRGEMPAILVRLTETVAWEFKKAQLPRITYRIGDPNGRLLRTHKGGASGHYTPGHEHIMITAGPDMLRVKGTVLHELAHWLSKDPTPHGPAFYRYLIALFRRFNVPMSHLNWEGETKAVRDGRKRLEQHPLVLQRTPRPTIGHTTPPIKPKIRRKPKRRTIKRAAKRTLDA